MSVSIRRATGADFEQIWAIFRPIIKAGETYAFDPDTTREQAYRLWMEAPLQTFVAELNEQVVGTYYIKPNQPALGAHVCNCGYMVAGSARGQGVATLMCEHSQTVALKLGFKAMQFNLVVATNTGAIRLWQTLGFDIIGRLPGAFRHRSKGWVDAFVFYKWLDPRHSRRLSCFESGIDSRGRLIYNRLLTRSGQHAAIFRHMSSDVEMASVTRISKPLVKAVRHNNG